jgi:hypothetical protein
MIELIIDYYSFLDQRFVRRLATSTGQARNNFYEINKINCLQNEHDVTL